MDQHQHHGITPDNPRLTAALEYAAFGWSSFPVPVGTKKSEKKGKRDADKKLIGPRWDATSDPDRIRSDNRAFPRSNIGVPTGPENGFFVLDADTIAGGHAANGIASLADLETKHGKLPLTRMVRSPTGSIHYYFKYPTHMRVGGSQSKIAPGIDICGDGNMVVVPPSVKPGIGVYQWESPGAAIADAPTWLLDKIAEAAKPKVPTIREQAVALIKIPENAFVRAGKASGDLAERRRAGWHASVFQAEIDRVAKAMPGERNAVLFQATANLGGYILGGADFTPGDVRTAMHAASQRNGSLDDDGDQQIAMTIESGLRSDRTRRDVPDFTDNNASKTDNVVRLVAPVSEQTAGEITRSSSAEIRAERPAPDGVDDDGDDNEPPAVSDTEFALADDFIAVYRADLRYVAKFGKWQVWHGTSWKADETVRVFDLARRICRRAAANKETPVAKAISKARTVAAVETLSRSHPSVAATVDQWDANPMKLNVLSGTIDLTTGELLPHDRLDYITKIAACDVAPVGTLHPLWSSFLHRMTGGDVGLIAFHQRWMGYCLTGLISEHRFFFGYGEGANGKGTFINTFVNILNDYATIANPATFMESTTERHTTEIAKLRGARLVVAQEVDEGKAWNESRIKAVTGGDRLTARFMRQDDFEFDPEFKLMMMANNQPTLRNVDEAMRRRLMLVPFTVTIPESERNPDLPDELKDEWPAILRWAVDGCLEWQRIGLAPPAAVTLATNEYFAEQDTFSMWLDEACDIRIGDGDVTERSADLYESWAAYSTKSGGAKPSSKSFSTKMTTKGFTKCTIGHDKHRGFSGVRLKLTQAERNFQTTKF
jgi:putative DNA primase/helicase